MTNKQIVEPKETLLSAEELNGYFNQQNDNFILNIEIAREERAEQILSRTL